MINVIIHVPHVVHLDHLHVHHVHRTELVLYLVVYVIVDSMMIMLTWNAKNVIILVRHAWIPEP